MVYEKPDGHTALLEAIEEALQVHDVHDGFPRERIALATNLANHGFVVEDIEFLASSIRATQKKNGAIGPILCAALKDPREATERVQDIRKGIARKKRRAEEPGRSERQMGTLSYGTDSEFAQLDENQHRRIAYALVVSDRKSAEYAAREIGCSVEQVEQWVATETAIREKDAPPRHVKGKLEPDTRTPEQRLADFRQFIAKGERP